MSEDRATIVEVLEVLRRLREAAGYNPPILMVGRAHVVMVLVILVVAFGSFHPYLDAAGLCGLGGCQEVSQSSHAAHTSFSTTCLVAVLAASPVALAFAFFFGRRRTARHSRPAEAYLSPDPPPPSYLSEPLGILRRYRRR